MKPLPWWLFAWVFAASVVVMMVAGLRWAQVFGVLLLFAVSWVLTRKERPR